MPSLACNWTISNLALNEDMFATQTVEVCDFPSVHVGPTVRCETGFTLNTYRSLKV
jgi:hypothetical protein